MKYAVTTIVIILFLTILGLFLKFDQSPKSLEINKFSTIQKGIIDGDILLDVRTPGEYAAGHIQGAQSLPLQDIQSGTLPKVNTDKTLYIYCQSGNRSSQATAILRKAGYRVEDLGGMDSVVAIGGTIVK
ncbi:MAG: rhodanese-like domain-containing protein [Patescibacteria group bacterium]